MVVWSSLYLAFAPESSGSGGMCGHGSGGGGHVMHDGHDGHGGGGGGHVMHDGHDGGDGHDIIMMIVMMVVVMIMT